MFCWFLYTENIGLERLQCHTPLNLVRVCPNYVAKKLQIFTEVWPVQHIKKLNGEHFNSVTLPAYLFPLIQIFNTSCLRCTLVFVVFPDFLAPSKHDLKHIKLITNDYQFFHFSILQNTGKLWKNSKIGMKWVKKRSTHYENFIVYYMVNLRFVLLLLAKQRDEKEINVQTLYVIETLERTI